MAYNIELQIIPSTKQIKRTMLYIINKPTMKIFAISLVVLGAVMLIWTGFTYTKKEKIIDAGPIQVSADRQKSVNWPPYAGGILVVAGVVIFATTKKNG